MAIVRRLSRIRENRHVTIRMASLVSTAGILKVCVLIQICSTVCVGQWLQSAASFQNNGQNRIVNKPAFPVFEGVVDSNLFQRSLGIPAIPNTNTNSFRETSLTRPYRSSSTGKYARRSKRQAGYYTQRIEDGSASKTNEPAHNRTKRQAPTSNDPSVQRWNFHPSSLARTMLKRMTDIMSGADQSRSVPSAVQRSSTENRNITSTSQSGRGKSRNKRRLRGQQPGSPRGRLSDRLINVRPFPPQTRGPPAKPMTNTAVTQSPRRPIPTAANPLLPIRSQPFRRRQGQRQPMNQGRQTRVPGPHVPAAMHQQQLLPIPPPKNNQPAAHNQQQTLLSSPAEQPLPPMRLTQTNPLQNSPANEKPVGVPPLPPMRFTQQTPMKMQSAAPPLPPMRLTQGPPGSRQPQSPGQTQQNQPPPQRQLQQNQPQPQRQLQPSQLPPQSQPQPNQAPPQSQPRQNQLPPQRNIQQNQPLPQRQPQPNQPPSQRQYKPNQPPPQRQPRPYQPMQHTQPQPNYQPPRMQPQTNQSPPQMQPQPTQPPPRMQPQPTQPPPQMQPQLNQLPPRRQPQQYQSQQQPPYQLQANFVQAQPDPSVQLLNTLSANDITNQQMMQQGMDYLPLDQPIINESPLMSTQLVNQQTNSMLPNMPQNQQLQGIQSLNQNVPPYQKNAQMQPGQAAVIQPGPVSSRQINQGNSYQQQQPYNQQLPGQQLMNDPTINQLNPSPSNQNAPGLIQADGQMFNPTPPPSHFFNQINNQNNPNMQNVEQAMMQNVQAIHSTNQQPSNGQMQPQTLGQNPQANNLMQQQTGNQFNQQPYANQFQTQLQGNNLNQQQNTNQFNPTPNGNQNIQQQNTNSINPPLNSNQQNQLQNSNKFNQVPTGNQLNQQANTNYFISPPKDNRLNQQQTTNQFMQSPNANQFNSQSNINQNPNQLGQQNGNRLNAQPNQVNKAMVPPTRKQNNKRRPMRQRKRNRKTKAALPNTPINRALIKPLSSKKLWTPIQNEGKGQPVLTNDTLSQNSQTKQGVALKTWFNPAVFDLPVKLPTTPMPSKRPPPLLLNQLRVSGRRQAPPKPTRRPTASRQTTIKQWRQSAMATQKPTTASLAPKPMTRRQRRPMVQRTNNIQHPPILERNPWSQRNTFAQAPKLNPHYRPKDKGKTVIPNIFVYETTTTAAPVPTYIPTQPMTMPPPTTQPPLLQVPSARQFVAQRTNNVQYTPTTLPPLTFPPVTNPQPTNPPPTNPPMRRSQRNRVMPNYRPQANPIPTKPVRTNPPPTNQPMRRAQRNQLMQNYRPPTNPPPTNPPPTNPPMIRAQSQRVRPIYRPQHNPPKNYQPPTNPPRTNPPPNRLPNVFMPQRQRSRPKVQPTYPSPTTPSSIIRSQRPRSRPRSRPKPRPQYQSPTNPPPTNPPQTNPPPTNPPPTNPSLVRVQRKRLRPNTRRSFARKPNTMRQFRKRPSKANLPTATPPQNLNQRKNNVGAWNSMTTVPQSYSPTTTGIPFKPAPPPNRRQQPTRKQTVRTQARQRKPTRRPRPRNLPRSTSTTPWTPTTTVGWQAPRKQMTFNNQNTRVNPPPPTTTRFVGQNVQTTQRPKSNSNDLLNILRRIANSGILKKDRKTTTPIPIATTPAPTPAPPANKTDNGELLRILRKIANSASAKQKATHTSVVPTTNITNVVPPPIPLDPSLMVPLTPAIGQQNMQLLLDALAHNHHKTESLNAVVMNMLQNQNSKHAQGGIFGFDPNVLPIIDLTGGQSGLQTSNNNAAIMNVLLKQPQQQLPELRSCKCYPKMVGCPVDKKLFHDILDCNNESEVICCDDN